MVTAAGQPLWLAAESFDWGFELTSSMFLPTNQVAPDTDIERAFMVASMEQTGLVSSSQTIQLVAQKVGRNFDGDSFYTDGRTVILMLWSLDRVGINFRARKPHNEQERTTDPATRQAEACPVVLSYDNGS